jgi:hypothetical protein
MLDDGRVALAVNAERLELLEREQVLEALRNYALECDLD